MKLKTLSLILITIFAVIGIVFTSLALHELSHYEDYRNVMEQGDICLFNVPINLTNASSLGYFLHSYNLTSSNEEASIEQYTEFKAYSITTIILLIGFSAISYYLSELWFDRKLEERLKVDETKDLNTSWFIK